MLDFVKVYPLSFGQFLVRKKKSWNQKLIISHDIFDNSEYFIGLKECSATTLYYAKNPLQISVWGK